MMPSFAQMLANRCAVNILKLAYDHEVTHKNQYTLNLSAIQKLLVLVEPPLSTIRLLADAELITTDAVRGDIVMSITHKGKEFIETFDQLREIYHNGQVHIPPMPAIRYALTIQEKKALAALGTFAALSPAPEPVLFKTLARELRTGRKTIPLLRTLSKLESLGLISKELKGLKGKKGRHLFVTLTDKGSRTVKEQYLGNR